MQRIFALIKHDGNSCVDKTAIPEKQRYGKPCTLRVNYYIHTSQTLRIVKMNNSVADYSNCKIYDNSVDIRVAVTMASNRRIWHCDRLQVSV